ncbi:MAG: FRG domain-containing protein [Rhodobacteraceae bacterium]|nr:FRG domain-containing protein [Paracoccaceae bacterium]
MVLNKIIDEILKKSNNMRDPVFRGQADENWPLESAAVRRLKQNKGEDIDLSSEVESYEANNLYHPYRTIGDENQGKHQVLSLLQHHGAATNYLDFSCNALTALWFACSNTSNETKNRNGKLFIIDIGPPHPWANEDEWIGEEESTMENEGEEESTMENEGRTGEAGYLYLYRYPNQNLSTRIVSQQSIFLKGFPNIPEKITTQISIDGKDKESIHKELKQIGISEKILFPDLSGFALQNGPDKPL